MWRNSSPAFNVPSFTYSGSVPVLPAQGSTIGEVVFNYADNGTYVYTPSGWMEIGQMPDLACATKWSREDYIDVFKHLNMCPEGPNRYCLTFTMDRKSDVVIDLYFSDASDLTAMCRIRDWAFEKAYSLTKVVSKKDRTIIKTLFHKSEKPFYLDRREIDIEKFFE